MTTLKGDTYYYSDQQLGIDRRTKDLVIERCWPFAQGPLVLDLGYVDGCWTKQILGAGWRSDIVEGEAKHIEAARKEYGHDERVRIFHSLFEDFQPDTAYDCIIAGDILRYIEQPAAFLSRLASWLAPDGSLIVTVPNSMSLHRRIGALMGFEHHPMAPNSRDVEVGNLRSYDRYTLRSDLLGAGLRIIELRGCFLKPLSSVQISGWDDRLLRAFLEIGDELENYTWFLYAVCKRP